MIQNEQQIKMMILYSLWSAGCPVPATTLSQVLTECGIGAIGTSGELCELAEKGHITIISDDGTDFAVLTKTGAGIVSTLGSDLTSAMREKLLLSTAREVAKLRKDMAVSATYAPREKGGFDVTVSLSDEGEPIMTLLMFAPTKAQAEIMTANFRDAPYEVYKTALSSLTKTRF